MTETFENCERVFEVEQDIQEKSQKVPKGSAKTETDDRKKKRYMKQAS